MSRHRCAPFSSILVYTDALQNIFFRSVIVWYFFVSSGPTLLSRLAFALSCQGVVCGNQPNNDSDKSLSEQTTWQSLVQLS
eukprot:3593423-Amphidinium_carterae.1